MPQQLTNHELRLRQFYAALFALVMVVVYLRISQLDGRLAADLTFDDVSYANYAARRFLLAAEHGLFAFVRSFTDSPPIARSRPYSLLARLQLEALTSR
jgi:hypothetical protein